MGFLNKVGDCRRQQGGIEVAPRTHICLLPRSWRDKKKVKDQFGENPCT
jgi:hypothetical protein